MSDEIDYYNEAPSRKFPVDRADGGLTSGIWVTSEIKRELKERVRNDEECESEVCWLMKQLWPETYDEGGE